MKEPHHCFCFLRRTGSGSRRVTNTLDSGTVAAGVLVAGPWGAGVLRLVACSATFPTPSSASTARVHCPTPTAPRSVSTVPCPPCPMAPHKMPPKCRAETEVNAWLKRTSMRCDAPQLGHPPLAGGHNVWKSHKRCVCTVFPAPRPPHEGPCVMHRMVVGSIEFSRSTVPPEHCVPGALCPRVPGALCPWNTEHCAPGALCRCVLQDSMRHKTSEQPK